MAILSEFQLVTYIRQLVNDTIVETGTGDTALVETLLIRNGHYCGRRFQCGDQVAVWFIEENEIKFYGETGALAQVVHPMISETARQVA